MQAAHKKQALPNPWDSRCPSRTILNLLATKWTLLLFPILAKGPHRNAELRRQVDGISPKVMTATLRELEAHGLLTRHDYETVPPKVDYRLTELGKTLAAAVGVLDRWVIEHYYEVAAAREAFRRKGKRRRS